MLKGLEATSRTLMRAGFRIWFLVVLVMLIGSAANVLLLTFYADSGNDAQSQEMVEFSMQVSLYITGFVYVLAAVGLWLVSVGMLVWIVQKYGGEDDAR